MRRRNDLEYRIENEIRKRDTLSFFDLRELPLAQEVLHALQDECLRSEIYVDSIFFRVVDLAVAVGFLLRRFLLVVVAAATARLLDFETLAEKNEVKDLELLLAFSLRHLFLFFDQCRVESFSDLREIVIFLRVKVVHLADQLV